MACFAFGDELGTRLGLLKTANHAFDQLIRSFRTPFLRIALNQLVELIVQALLPFRQQFQLIGAVPAFQGALAPTLAVQLLQQDLLANHHGGHSGTRGQFQIKVGEVAVVPDQGWPGHGDALRAISRRCLQLLQRDGHGAGFRPASSAEKQALIGFQQIEANCSEVKAA